MDPRADPSLALPVWLSLGAMCVNGAFGAAVARSRYTPVFGVLLAGIVVGLGGGMVRDVLLNTEPVAIKDWYYIPAVLLAAGFGAVLFNHFVSRKQTYLLVQGVALGLLVTVGAQRALEYSAPFPSAVFLGVLTASAGGAITDTLTQHRAALLSQAHWLGLALLVGTLAFIPLSLYVNFYLAVVVTVVIVTLLRVFSVSRNWSSLSFPGETTAPLAKPEPPQEH